MHYILKKKISVLWTFEIEKKIDKIQNDKVVHVL